MFSKKSLLCSLLSLIAVNGQTTTAASSADGLSTSAASLTQTVVTVTNNNQTMTYRAIPTLDSSVGDYGNIIPNVDDPLAVNAQSVCPGYKATKIKNTARGFSATLILAGNACNVYGTDIQSLDLLVQFQSNDRLAVKISPTYLDASNTTQYVIPSNWVREPGVQAGSKLGNSDLQVTYTNSPSFGLTIIRKSTGDVLFDTVGSVLVFENQFVEFRTVLPENYNVYGLGERLSSLRLPNNYTATMYATDTGDPFGYGLYGVHPFYLDTRYYSVNPNTGTHTLITDTAASTTGNVTGVSHGVYYRNSHPHEVILQPTSLTWRTLGGNIELYFYDGPSQADVTTQHTSVIGLPAMQQYFTFGYHQCRWGYSNWSEVQDVVDNMRNFNIPLETVWTDIDYMNQYRDFENDQNRFSYAEAAVFLGSLHASNQHYVPIVDSAIYIPNPNNASDAYGVYTRGNASNAFLTNVDGQQYIGDVWPGYTVFPDWRAAGTQDWWTNEMSMWHDNVDFDGIWIDMSEVSSFCVGSCGTGHVTDNPVHPPFQLPGETNNVVYSYPENFSVTNATEWASVLSASSAQASRISATQTPQPTTTTPYLRTTPTPGIRNVTYPPYTIRNANGALGGHAVSPDAMHADGTEEYDIHNLFGDEIIKATYNALTTINPGKRPFIIGRSNFAGSGAYAGHWGGDNTAEWIYMAASIPQALSHSLFGFPMFGVDTCGFNGNTDEELCNRWMQLSAFFPFYRNHNVLSAISQEPYRWASVITASQTAMNIRYNLLPYIYTLFHSAHTTGSTVMRALAWEFPNDPTLAGADLQFMLGPSIMVTPVLTPQATSVDGVFPGVAEGTVWYDWYTQAAVAAEAGANITIDAPLGHIPVYIRGGSVLPLQQPGYTTTDSRANPWSVLVALSSTGTASGSLYLDDGASLSPPAVRNIALTASAGTLYVSGTGGYNAPQPLSSIQILGVASKPSLVQFNGQDVGTWSYTGEVLEVTGFEVATAKGAWMSNWELTWS